MLRFWARADVQFDRTVTISRGRLGVGRLGAAD